MLRGVGLTLLCLAAIAVPAQASDRGHVTVAAQRGAALALLPATAPERREPARVRAVSASGQAALRRGSVGGFRGGMVKQPVAPVTLQPQTRERQDLLGFPWLRPDRAGVAVPLTERFRLGLGYRHVEGEDLWPEFADTGAADYHSHHLLIRASWRF